MKVKPIHTTIGVYNSDDMKFNGVEHELLCDHILYNIKNRPGRAFFVDGVCINRGYLTREKVAELELLFNSDSKYTVTRDTAPYV